MKRLNSLYLYKAGKTFIKDPDRKWQGFYISPQQNRIKYRYKSTRNN